MIEPATGDELCGTLTWLGYGADNEENLPYLNTLLIDHAPPVGENRWRGKLHIFGQTATGAITQVSDNRIELEGCVAFVLCRTYQLYRLWCLPQRFLRYPPCARCSMS